jgi:hypothetical protein
MMLDHLGHKDASRAIMQAIETTLKNEATISAARPTRQRAAGLWPLRSINRRDGLRVVGYSGKDGVDRLKRRFGSSTIV